MLNRAFFFTPMLAAVCMFGCNGAEAAEPAFDRVRFLAESLDKRIEKIEAGDIALPALLEYLCDQASPPEAGTNPSKRVVIVVSITPEVPVALLEEEPEPIRVRFQTKLVNVRLETVLGVICREFDGVVLMRSDFIEIRPRIAALMELGLATPFKEILEIQMAHGPFLNGFRIDNFHPPMPPLVHCFFNKVPLDKALEEIAERHNLSIVLMPRARAKKAVPITARLVNVPYDTAVETLADLAGLRIARKANLLRVTSKDID